MVLYPRLARCSLVFVAAIALIACGGHRASQDNEPPVFLSSSDPISFSENSTEVIYTANASDPDGNSVYYFVSGGDDSEHFVIDATSGELRFQEAQDLENPDDADRDSVYVVELAVGDIGGAVANMSLTVSLTDINEPPIIATGQIFAIDPNSVAGTSVGHVAASDDGNNLQSWTITDGNSENVFAMGSDGEIILADATKLNQEPSASSYALVLTVGDGYFTSSPEAVQINLAHSADTGGEDDRDDDEGRDDDEDGGIEKDDKEDSKQVDDRPAIQKNQVFIVQENSANNALIGSVKTSGDTGDISIQDWSITDGNMDDAFSIDSEDGDLRVANANMLDYDTGYTNYILELTARDSSGTTLNENIQVKLSDTNDEIPSINPNQAFYIDENATDGTFVAKALASDTDKNTTFQNWRTESGNFDGAFHIDPSNGYIYIADTNKLDYETASSHYWEVAVSDGKHLATPAVITINLVDVNDELPVIAEDLLFTVDENATNGTLVGAVIANDGDTELETIYQDWTITGGDPNQAFTIDTNGNIKVADTTQLDYESGTTSYDLELTVSDGINTSAKQVLTVNLNNVNDEAPVIASNQTFTVEENSAGGSWVGKIEVTDSDASHNVSWAWTIVAGNTHNAFTIDADGNIEVSANNVNVINYESDITSYALTVTASDGIQASAEQTVVINVANVNEAPSVGLNYSFKNSHTDSEAMVISGAEITLDGSSSYDPEGDAIVSYEWSQPSEQAADLNTTSGSSVAFIATRAQDYTFTLAVTDGALANSSEIVVAVEESALPNDFNVNLGNGSGQLDLSWTPYTSKGDAIYNIHRSSDADCLISGGCTGSETTTFLDVASGFVDRDLANGTTYYYIIEAVRDGGVDGYVIEQAAAAISGVAIGALNDSGVVWEQNSSTYYKWPDGDYFTSCDSSSDIEAPQDCDQGRDATDNNDSDGYAGFNFTRLNSADGSENNGADYEQDPWGCIRDNTTGLIWEVKNSDSSSMSQISRKFTLVEQSNAHYAYDLVDELNNKKLCGYDDWRIPTIDEIQSIFIFSGKFIDNGSRVYFDNSYLTPSTGYVSDYWSISPSNDTAGKYLAIKQKEGEIYYDWQAEEKLVRLVRSGGNYAGSNWSSERYQVHGDGTVTDLESGLIWMLCSLGQSYESGSCSGEAAEFASWAEALQEAAKDEYANSGWRLPNAKELSSLVARDRKQPSINTSIFANTPYDSKSGSGYWSSTPSSLVDQDSNEYGFPYSVMVSFDYGLVQNVYRDGTHGFGPYYVRLVQSVR